MMTAPSILHCSSLLLQICCFETFFCCRRKCLQTQSHTADLILKDEFKGEFNYFIVHKLPQNTLKSSSLHHHAWQLLQCVQSEMLHSGLSYKTIVNPSGFMFLANLQNKQWLCFLHVKKLTATYLLKLRQHTQHTVSACWFHLRVLYLRLCKY